MNTPIFIKLTNAENDSPLYIDVHNIEGVSLSSTKERTFVYTIKNTTDKTLVCETPDKIYNKIQELPQNQRPIFVKLTGRGKSLHAPFYVNVSIIEKITKKKEEEGTVLCTAVFIKNDGGNYFCNETPEEAYEKIQRASQQYKLKIPVEKVTRNDLIDLED
jgi:hypothetical protein